MQREMPCYLRTDACNGLSNLKRSGLSFVAALAVVECFIRYNSCGL